MDRMVVGAIPEEPLVEVENLSVHFRMKSNGLGFRPSLIHAVDDISFAIRRGEVLGLVGESGCGKSSTARALLRLRVPSSGTIRFDGVDLMSLSKAGLRAMRRRMQLVHQDPYSSLNPRMTVGNIVKEPLDVHRVLSKQVRDDHVVSLLGMVGLSADYADRYPGELSGGQRQRIGIARALAVQPELLVCDEPVAALDVSIQAQVLNLLAQLRTRLGLTYLFISHDLSVIKHVSHSVAVMYLGKIVEIGRTSNIYTDSGHPYTRALLSAVPAGNRTLNGGRQQIVLQGELPSVSAPPSGCRFHTRCWLYEQLGKPDACRNVEPPLIPLNGQQSAACHYSSEAQASKVGSVGAGR